MDTLKPSEEGKTSGGINPPPVTYPADQAKLLDLIKVLQRGQAREATRSDELPVPSIPTVSSSSDDLPFKEVPAISVHDRLSAQSRSQETPFFHFDWHKPTERSIQIPNQDASLEQEPHLSTPIDVAGLGRVTTSGGLPSSDITFNGSTYPFVQPNLKALNTHTDVYNNSGTRSGNEELYQLLAERARQEAAAAQVAREQNATNAFRPAFSQHVPSLYQEPSLSAEERLNQQLLALVLQGNPTAHSMQPGLDASSLEALQAAWYGMKNPLQKNSSGSLYKTELCRTWSQTASCRYGSKCQFAHGVKEQRPIQRHPKYKTELCRTYSKTGMCPYGVRCRFIHHQPNLWGLDLRTAASDPFLGNSSYLSSPDSTSSSITPMQSPYVNTTFDPRLNPGLADNALASLSDYYLPQGLGTTTGLGLPPPPMASTATSALLRASLNSDARTTTNGLGNPLGWGTNTLPNLNTDLLQLWGIQDPSGHSPADVQHQPAFDPVRACPTTTAQLLKLGELAKDRTDA